MTSLPEGQTYDLDPSKVGEQQVAINQKAVELVASSFLEIITSSVPVFPSYVLLNLDRNHIYIWLISIVGCSVNSARISLKSCMYAISSQFSLT